MRIIKTIFRVSESELMSVLCQVLLKGVWEEEDLSQISRREKKLAKTSCPLKFYVLLGMVMALARMLDDLNGPVFMRSFLGWDWKGRK